MYFVKVLFTSVARLLILCEYLLDHVVLWWFCATPCNCGLYVKDAVIQLWVEHPSAQGIDKVAIWGDRVY